MIVLATLDMGRGGSGRRFGGGGRGGGRHGGEWQQEVIAVSTCHWNPLTTGELVWFMDSAALMCA